MTIKLFLLSLVFLTNIITLINVNTKDIDHVNFLMALFSFIIVCILFLI